MRNLLLLIIRYSAFILFLVLEFIAFSLVVRYNKSQKEIWMHSSNLLAGKLYERVEEVEDFIKLNEINDSLLDANAKLREIIINYRVSSKENAFQNFEQKDSLYAYEMIPAVICNKTLNLRNNYMTLCLGEKDGIRKGMGVISDYGIVGIIKSVSKNFSTVLLTINSQSRISAKIKRSAFPGTVRWLNSDPRILSLTEIPKHASVEVGDTVLTSGYSVSFPPEVYIGTISDFKLDGAGNNFNIDIKLDYELARLEYVYVVDYKLQDEKREILKYENE